MSLPVPLLNTAHIIKVDEDEMKAELDELEQEQLGVELAGARSVTVQFPDRLQNTRVLSPHFFALFTFTYIQHKIHEPHQVYLRRKRRKRKNCANCRRLWLCRTIRSFVHFCLYAVPFES